MTWNQLTAYVIKLLKMEQKVDKNSADIEKLQDQVVFLTQKSDSQDAEIQRDRENAQRDRAQDLKDALYAQSQLILRLENVLLQHGILARQGLLPEDPEKAEMRKELEALRKQTAAPKQIDAKNSDENETQ